MGEVVQTSTRAGLGFRAGVKDYRLTYFMDDYKVIDTDLLAAFRGLEYRGVPSRYSSSLSRYLVGRIKGAGYVGNIRRIPTGPIRRRLSHQHLDFHCG